MDASPGARSEVSLFAIAIAYEYDDCGASTASIDNMSIPSTAAFSNISAATTATATNNAMAAYDAALLSAAQHGAPAAPHAPLSAAAVDWQSLIALAEIEAVAAHAEAAPPSRPTSPARRGSAMPMRAQHAAHQPAFLRGGARNKSFCRLRPDPVTPAAAAAARSACEIVNAAPQKLAVGPGPRGGAALAVGVVDAVGDGGPQCANFVARELPTVRSPPARPLLRFLRGAGAAVKQRAALFPFQLSRALRFLCAATSLLHFIFALPILCCILFLRCRFFVAFIFCAAASLLHFFPPLLCCDSSPPPLLCCTSFAPPH